MAVSESNLVTLRTQFKQSLFLRTQSSSSNMQQFKSTKSRKTSPSTDPFTRVTQRPIYGHQISPNVLRLQRFRICQNLVRQIASTECVCLDFTSLFLLEKWNVQTMPADIHSNDGKRSFTRQICLSKNIKGMRSVLLFIYRISNPQTHNYNR